MRWARFGTTALGLAILVVSMALTGCGGSKDDDGDGGRAKGGRKGPKVGKKDGGQDRTAATGTPVRSGTGTLRGKVKLGGDKPDLAQLTAELQKAMKLKPTELPY